MDDVNVNIERFVKNKIYKKQRKLVLAVILILLGVIAFIYQYMTYKRIVDNPVSIEDMADKNGESNSCYYIYMTIDSVLNEFTKNGDQSVCFAYVGDECYIVEADPQILNGLNLRRMMLSQKNIGYSPIICRKRIRRCSWGIHLRMVSCIISE